VERFIGSVTFQLAVQASGGSSTFLVGAGFILACLRYPAGGDEPRALRSLGHARIRHRIY